MLMESVMDAGFLCISETGPSSFHVRDLTQRKICERREQEVSASTKVCFIPREAERAGVEWVQRE
jgi:hypothetical protein